MEDETRLTDRPGAMPSDDTVIIRSDAGAGPTAGGAATPSNPDTARVMIEQTRARMSETIDEIEDVLIRKKEQLQDRLDVLSPVRERPLPSLGVALGAGILLGLITGGGSDRDEGYAHDRDDFDDFEARADHWERRARRLLRIAQEQEDQLEALGQGRADRVRSSWADEAESRPVADSSPSALSNLGDEIAERVSDLISGLVSGLFGGGSSAR